MEKDERSAAIQNEAIQEASGREPSGSGLRAETVILTGAQSLRNATELRARLLHALDMPGGVVVDTTGVESVDMSTVQILLAAQKMAAAKGLPFSIGAEAGGAISIYMMETGFIGAMDSMPG